LLIDTFQVKITAPKNFLLTKIATEAEPYGSTKQQDAPSGANNLKAFAPQDENPKFSTWLLLLYAFKPQFRPTIFPHFTTIS
jgi:hypothetical protein